MEYQFGEPDKYDDFPYIRVSSKDEAKFNALLLERLPDDYNMQIVCPVEEQVLADLSTLGIDSHLEAMTMTKADRIEDRKIGDRVVQRHHALDFTKEGMICLIRRLKDYSPSQFDHSECEFGPNDYDYDSDTPEEFRDGPVDFMMAAYQLRAAILSTLDIEDTDSI